MVDFLTSITPTFREPSAILVISAHWEEQKPTITSGESPSLIYDYYGFPEESYQIRYPAPGHPALAHDILRMLKEAGLGAELDDQRGFDHGLFVPLKIMYPAALIPCVQLSLVAGLDPEIHIRVGKALSEIRRQNVLILGSGFSIHNLRAFFSSGTSDQDSMNDAFQDWLRDTCTRTDVTSEERERALIQWKNAPFARFCHPREEHLLPLHVCYGIAGSASRVVFDGKVLGKRALGLLW